MSTGASEPLPDAIADRYTILSRLGSGAMGVVYLAHDKVLDIKVAIKMLNRHANTEAIIRFQKEAVAAGKLNHPNIARIQDFGFNDKFFYMVMEYAQGESLAHLLANEGRLSEEAALEIFMQMCTGMSYAHECGVIHRDIKPSNVILEFKNDGSIACKIVDFGIAKLQVGDQRLTNSGSYLGTPAYVSPEQATNREVTVRSDIYSLGCMMFECLAGKPPFFNESAIETINQKIQEAAPSLALRCQDELSPELVDIVDKCLERDPANRFDSMNSLADALEPLVVSDVAIIEEESPAAIANPAPPNMAPQSLRIITARNAAIVGLVLVGSGLLFWQMARHISFQTNPQPQGRQITTVSRALPAVEALRMDMRYDPIKIDPVHPASVSLKREAQDADFKKVAKLKQTRDLFVTANTITGEGFRYIVDMPIERLTLDHTEAGDLAFKYISKMKSLDALILKKNEEISEEALLTLSPLAKTLTTLEITSSTLSDKTASYLLHFPNLRQVGLAGSTRITDRSVPLLMQLPKLQVLYISGTSISPEGITVLSKSPLLNELKLDGSKLNDHCLDAIARSNITFLSLEQTNLTDEQLRHVANSKKLAALSIDGRKLSKNALNIISAMKSLTSLYIDSAQPNFNFKPLSKTNLTHLMVKHSPVFKEQLDDMILIPKLEGLSIIRCRVVTGDCGETLKSAYKNRWGRDLELRADIDPDLPEYAKDFDTALPPIE